MERDGRSLIHGYPWLCRESMQKPRPASTRNCVRLWVSHVASGPRWRSEACGHWGRFFWIIGFGRIGAGIWRPLQEDFLVEVVEGRVEGDITHKNQNWLPPAFGGHTLSLSKTLKVHAGSPEDLHGQEGIPHHYLGINRNVTSIWFSGKGPPCQCRRLEFHPWVGKISRGRKRQCTPGFLPRKSHGQRSLAGYSAWGCERVRLHSSNTLSLQSQILEIETYPWTQKKWPQDRTYSISQMLNTGR